MDLKQDSFTKEQLSQMISEGKLQKGQYQLDIGFDGGCKVSLVQKRWVQKSDVSGD